MIKLDIRKLMLDFNCTKTEDMNFRFMAERTRYLKENPKGVSNMCKAMEELRVESIKEGIEQGIEQGEARKAQSMAQKLYQKGYSIEDIAEMVEYDTDTVKGWLTPKAG